MFIRPKSKLRTKRHKQRQTRHLRRQPRNHNINTHLITTWGIRAACDGAARCLEEKGDEIAADECDGVDGGAEAGDGGAEDDDDAGETEIDAGGEEGGPDCYAD